jgi:Leucine-rich repeat (LRR) protein
MLSLENNQLSGEIPPELGDLTELYQLWLENNQLSGRVPPELRNLSKLRDFDICSNHLFADDEELRVFLKTKQDGWERCQNPSSSQQ